MTFEVQPKIPMRKYTVTLSYEFNYKLDNKDREAIATRLSLTMSSALADIRMIKEGVAQRINFEASVVKENENEKS